MHLLAHSVHRDSETRHGDNLNSIQSQREDHRSHARAGKLDTGPSTPDSTRPIAPKAIDLQGLLAAHIWLSPKLIRLRFHPLHTPIRTVRFAIQRQFDIRSIRRVQAHACRQRMALTTMLVPSVLNRTALPLPGSCLPRARQV